MSCTYFHLLHWWSLLLVCSAVPAKVLCLYNFTSYWLTKDMLAPLMLAMVKKETQWQVFWISVRYTLICFLFFHCLFVILTFFSLQQETLITRVAFHGCAFWDKYCVSFLQKAWIKNVSLIALSVGRNGSMKFFKEVPDRQFICL